MSEDSSQFDRSNVRLFSDAFLATISLHDDPFISAINSSLSELNELRRQLPDRYGWRFRSTSAMEEELTLLQANLANVEQINRFYWTDTLKTCEAYTVMSAWRMVDLARSAVLAIERNECASAALLSRAAIESAAQYADAARTISKTIQAVEKSDFSRNVVVSADLENYLLKTVYGSRLPESEKYYSPTNITTILNRTAKIPGQSQISSHYEFLCEVAHPNFIGRSIYILESTENDRPGDETRILSFENGPSAKAIMLSSIWALSWASATQVSATHLMQSGLRNMLNVLPE